MRYFLAKLSMPLLIIAIFSAIISSFVLVKSTFYVEDIFLVLGTIVSYLFHVGAMIAYKRKTSGILKYILLGEVFFLGIIVLNFIQYGYGIALALGAMGILGVILDTRNTSRYLQYGMYIGIITFFQWYIYTVYNIENIFSQPAFFGHLLAISISTFLLIETRVNISQEHKGSDGGNIGDISRYYLILSVLILYVITGLIFFKYGENIFEKIGLNIMAILSIFVLFFSYKSGARISSFFFVFLLCTVLHFSFLDIIHPTNDKHWIYMFKKTAYAEISNNLIHVHNIRNFHYKTSHNYNPDWYDKEYDLSKIVRVDYIINAFALGGRLGHNLLSFGFEDGSYLSISVEGRRTEYKYTNWDVFRWNFKQYEKIYIVSDERDILVLRGAMWGEKIYLHELQMPKADMQKLLLSLLQAGNVLKEKPEFIMPMTNCNQTLWNKHLNKIYSWPFSFSNWMSTNIFSGKSDQFIYEQGFIKNNENFEIIKKKSLVNDRIQKYKNDPDFSKKIRDISENE